MPEKLIKKLTSIIKERKVQLPEDSYVAKLFKSGKVKIANKLGEEATETVSAFLSQTNKEILEESADLIFHLMVLLEHKDLTLEEVFDVLERRIDYD